MAKTTYIVGSNYIADKNVDKGENHPPWRVFEGADGPLQYAHSVVIHGPSRVVYDPDQPLCGSHLWVETEAEVTLVHGWGMARGR